MSTLKDIVEFRSTKFSPVLPEECQVNPRVYGAELAFWLCCELARAGVATGYPQWEDWGWYIEYQTDDGSEFAIHCCNTDEAGEEWLLSLRRYGRKMFGRDKPPFSGAARLIDGVRECLEAEPEVTELEWCFPVCSSSSELEKTTMGHYICVIVFAALATAGSLSPMAAQVRFTEDFEGDLSRWELYGEQGVALRASGDPAHGGVLALTPHGDVYALIRGSEEWGAVRMEGEVFFPEDTDHYLGVVYNYRRRAERTDFGVVYIKGNGSYLRVNPHRDLNVGRTLYEEYRTPLEGADAIRIAEWQRFKVEIVGARCHFYVGDMAVPKLTFSLLELDHGPVGLQPRSVGGEVWVDNLTVTSVDRFSYRGPDKPRDFDYSTESLLTTWEVVGSLERTMDEVARRPDDPNHPWRAFETDARGAVITARVTDYHGPRSVAYFRTRVRSDAAGEAFLHISTVDDLAVWVNGRFHWFISRSRLAWYDFWTNEDHAGQRIPVDLIAGENEIVIRVRGGVYASGGFFARVEGSAY